MSVMISEAGPIQQSFERVREWIKRELFLKQKPELDKKIDQMLKPLKQVNKIMVWEFGLGKRFGKKLSLRGLGASLKKVLRFL